MSSPTIPPASRGRSHLAAAGLSFIWPGLGQWYLGRRRDAILYAAPVVALAAILLQQVSGGLTSFAIRLLDPSISLALLVVVAILAVWRILAIADAGLQPRMVRSLRGRAGVVLGVLVALVVLTHAVVGYYAWSFYSAGGQIFVGSGRDGPDTPGLDGSGPLATDPYNVPPFATPPPQSQRITALFTGVDKSTERDHSLTDTLLVVSFDPVTGKTAMISFPRDLAGFPMYNGGTYEGKINSLMTYAGNHPKLYPEGALPTLVHELSFLVGIPINYFAAIDLDGFQRMIDAVGGVRVNVERAIADPRYDWLDGSNLGFYLSAGPHTLDGRIALAYVRSRYGAGDNDFTRASRQQQLLLALRSKLTDPSMLGKLPAVLRVAADTIRTNFPPERLDEVLQLAQGADPSQIVRVVLQPSTYSFHPPTNTTGGTYVLRLKWEALQALSAQLFGTDSQFWTATAIPSASPGP